MPAPTNSGAVRRDGTLSCSRPNLVRWVGVSRVQGSTPSSGSSRGRGGRVIPAGAVGAGGVGAGAGVHPATTSAATISIAPRVVIIGGR